MAVKKWDSSVDCQMCENAYGRKGCDLCPFFCLQIEKAKQQRRYEEAERITREVELKLEEEAIKQRKDPGEIHKGEGGGKQRAKPV